MSSINADKEIKRSGDGVLTIGKEIGYDELSLEQYKYKKG